MLNTLAKRAILLVPGGVILILTFILTALRRPDGWLLPEGWTLAVVGLATILALVCLGTRWQRFASLLALALVGQACALQLLDSPPYSVYQHYFSWNQDLISWRDVAGSLHLILLLALLAQTLIVGKASRPIWPALRDWVSGVTTAPRRVFLILVLAFAGVLLSRSVFRYGIEVLLTGWIAVISVLNLVLVTAAIPPDVLNRTVGRLQFLSGDGGEGNTLAERLERLLPLLVSVWVTVAAALIAWSVFERVPHIPDDVSYLFQAKYLSTGSLYLPAPPDSASFAISHVVNDGTKWFGYGVPGWPSVLALGVIAGVPWLVNPLLAGLTVLLIHALTRRLYGRPLANAVVLLLALSPWFLFISASFMAHTLSVVWTLMALLAVEKERASGKGLWGTLAGFFAGALFLTRPLEGILVGAAIGLWALGVGGARLSWRALTGLVTAAVLVGGLIFSYNYVLTGDPLYAPQMKWTDEAWYTGADRLGFGSNIGNVGWPHIDPLPGHGPADVLINANKNLYMTNFELFGWSFGSLCFAAIALLWGDRRRADTVFAAILMATIAGHSFYWFSGGPDFGARYWYQAIVPLLVLTVRGLQTVLQRLEQRDGWSVAKVRLPAFVALASLVAFVNVMPWRSLEKYHRYRGVSGDVLRLAQSHDFGRSLVFIRAEDQRDYSSAFVLNPPTLEAAGTIYAVDGGPEQRTALRSHFPDRPVWFVGRTSPPEGRMQVLAGPLPPGESDSEGPAFSSAQPEENRNPLMNVAPN